MKEIKGYKVFNPDFTCKGYQYAENSEFKFDGKISMCYAGFHFFENAADCFSYYSFDPNNIVCEVIGSGEIIKNDSDSKVCTNHLKVGRRLSWLEVLQVVNTGKENTGLSNSGYSNSGDRNSGDRNSGDSNSGYRNSGDSNSGYRNSGDRNSGYRNSGDSNSGDRNSGYRNSGNNNSGYWNSGDNNSGDNNSGNNNSGNNNSGNNNSGDSNSGYRNSGAFCTDDNPTIRLFNKDSKIKIRDWEKSKAVQVMRRLETNIWICESEMTNHEKEKHPHWETTDGYLKQISLKDAWANLWGNLVDEDKKAFTDLPNFDAAIFEEITGIRI